MKTNYLTETITSTLDEYNWKNWTTVITSISDIIRIHEWVNKSDIDVKDVRFEVTCIRFRNKADATFFKLGYTNDRSSD